MVNPDDVSSQKNTVKAWLFETCHGWPVSRDQLSVSSHHSITDGHDGTASQGKMRLITAPSRGRLHQKVSGIHSESVEENKIGIPSFLQ